VSYVVSNGDITPTPIASSCRAVGLGSVVSGARDDPVPSRRVAIGVEGDAALAVEDAHPSPRLGHFKYLEAGDELTKQRTVLLETAR
jgi:hypothetical protein